MPSSHQRFDLADASGWNSNCLVSSTTPQQGTFDLGASASVITNDQYDFYVYDSTDDATVNYDHVLIVPNAAGEDCSKAVANLAPGEWADVKVVLANPAGKTGGFYVKAMLFAPDLSKFSLFFTSVTRAVATYNQLGSAGCAAFEEYLNANFPSSTVADYAIYESGLVDADTYVEQGLKWKDAHYAYLNYIINTLGDKPDLLMLGNPVTDGILTHVPWAYSSHGQRPGKPILQQLLLVRRAHVERGGSIGRRDAGGDRSARKLRRRTTASAPYRINKYQL